MLKPVRQLVLTVNRTETLYQIMEETHIRLEFPLLYKVVDVQENMSEGEQVRRRVAKGKYAGIELGAKCICGLRNGHCERINVLAEPKGYLSK
jgi:hypothetical protein